MRKILWLWLLICGPAAAQESPHFRYMVTERFIHKLDVPIDAKNREEHRWYVSQVVADASPELAADNFAAQVLTELLDGLLSLRSAGDGIEVVGGATGFATLPEAQASRLKTLENLKAGGGNIYTFTWTVVKPVVEGPKPKRHFGEPEPPPKPPEVLPKASPKLFYRDENQPNYEPARKPRERF